MGTYNKGICNVHNGSNSVDLFGVTYEEIIDALAPGDLFVRNGDTVTYQIGSIVSGISHPSLALSSNYAGTTGSGLAYEVCRDFTPYLSLPSVYGADRANLASLIQEAWNILDQVIVGDKGLAAPTEGYHPLGFKRWNSNPVSGENVGWICVEAGTPGVFKAFGLISL